MPSMFDMVRDQKWLVRIFLVIICIPFALFGVEWYERGGQSIDSVATVDGEKVSVSEFGQRLQAQQDQLRQMFGRNFDISMFDTPAARESVLDQIVTERVLGHYVTRKQIIPGDADLAASIAEMPEFQEGGSFSKERYAQLVRSSGRSPVQFQEETRRALAFQRVRGALMDSTVASRRLAEREAVLAAESRDVSEVVFAPAQFTPQVKVAADAVEQYYKDNPREFEVPEAVKAEYLVLNLETYSAQVNVTPEDVKKLYDDRFAVKLKQRDDARRKADDLLAKVRRNPADFAEVARSDSDDPGSKENGGDLGFNPRGSMVQAFDDTVFKLKPKEVSGVVETEFGFHIIMLEEVRKGEGGGKAEERRARHILVAGPTDAKTFAEARPEIERDLRRQRASAEFPKLVERFTSQADQQLDALKPLADEFKLPLQVSEWVPRAGGPGAGALGSSRMLAALFDTETLKTKRSTEAVEVNSGVHIVARPIEHRQATVRALDEARADIQKKLVEREARALAKKAGEDRLATLGKGGEAGTKWANPRAITRENPTGLSKEAARAIFRADTAKLPVHVGLETPDGSYTVYRISKAGVGAPPDDKQVQAAQTSLERSAGQEGFSAFVQGLRKDTKVEINKANLERRG